MCPVGDHREDRVYELGHCRRPVIPRLSPQDLLEPELLPDLLDDPHHAVGPRVADGHAITGDAAIPHHAQDATRESAQIVVIEVVSAAEVVDDLR